MFENMLRVVFSQSVSLGDASIFPLTILWISRTKKKRPLNLIIL